MKHHKLNLTQTESLIESAAVLPADKAKQPDVVLRDKNREQDLASGQVLAADKTRLCSSYLNYQALNHLKIRRK